MSYDKLPGEWYGPTTAAYVLRDLALLHRRQQQQQQQQQQEGTGGGGGGGGGGGRTGGREGGREGGVRVLVTQAEVIYIDEVNRLCAAPSSLPSSSSSSSSPPSTSTTLQEENNGPPSSSSSSLPPAPTPFFDPLLHRPPSVVEADRRAAEKLAPPSLRPWRQGEGAILLVPLR